MGLNLFSKHVIITAKTLLLTGFVLVFTAAAAQAQNPEGTVFFPEINIFKPLVADPKEPGFFVGIHHFDNETRRDFTGAAVGYGETFGLIQKNLGRKHAWQLSIGGGIFSHFDMDTSSNNLLNSDYTIGVHWTYLHKEISLRLRAYHQSSHLGDEYARQDPRLLEASTGFDYEAMDILVAWERDKFRLYGGPHFLVQRDPSDIDRWGYQAGLEYRGTEEVLPGGKFIAGLDIKGFQEINWTPAYSLKGGLSFKNLGQTERSIKLLAEYYNGFIPYGQYYDFDMESLGLAMYFGF